MRIPATLDVPGEVLVLGPGAKAPEKGVAIRSRRVLVDRVDVGELVAIGNVATEAVHEWGREEPVEVLVGCTSLAVMLELGDDQPPREP